MFGSWTRRTKIALLGPVFALGLAVPAQAAGVDVTAAPTISGTPAVGAKLTANGGAWTGPSGTTVGRIWLQCPSASANEWSCNWIDNSNATTYTVKSGDKDKYMRVLLYASRSGDFDYKVSSATAKIGPAPTPTPTPTPVKTPTPRATPVRTATPTPTPVKTPAPTATPVKTVVPTPTPTPNGVPSDAAPVVIAEATPAPVALPAPTPVAVALAKPSSKRAAKPRMIRPYPTIRVSGSLTKTGADVALLTVKAPKGVRITLTCKGPSCPLREVAQATAVVHIPQFERELRAGTKLTITVTKPGYISKVTTITIRKGKSPARTDRCQAPGETRLTRCPKKG